VANLSWVSNLREKIKRSRIYNCDYTVYKRVQNIMKHKNKILILILSFAVVKATAQDKDTTAMLKDFNKVMSFGAEPYLHYTAVTKISSYPVMQKEDTLTTNVEYYKNESNYYSGTQREELYIEDSLYIEVNHNRKTIWVSTVNDDIKKNMNKLPIKNKEWQALFKRDYTISQAAINKTTSRLNFKTVQKLDSLSQIVVNIGLQYASKNYMPQIMEMDVNARQAIAEETVQQLKDNGTNTSQLVQKIAGISYMIRNQKLTMEFSNMDNSKEKARQMPSWKDKLDYDEATKEFTAKEKYSDYEVTKTF
jgi:hypothetical protein